MNILILLLLLLSLLVASLPVYIYSRDWGYYPSGVIAAITLIVALMLVLR